MTGKILGELVDGYKLNDSAGLMSIREVLQHNESQLCRVVFLFLVTCINNLSSNYAHLELSQPPSELKKTFQAPTLKKKPIPF